MRKKPDISGFATPKDPTAFLESGTADVAERPIAVVPTLPTQPVVAETLRRGRGKIQKIFNFPEELADRLRDEAIARSRATGTRVTEKDIVLAALDAYLNQ